MVAGPALVGSQVGGPEGRARPVESLDLFRLIISLFRLMVMPLQIISNQRIQNTCQGPDKNNV